jgi:hypothetical protein
MPGIKLRRLEESQIPGGTRTGNTLVTAAKLLLWLDLIPLAFVYVGIRGGSHFWMWWVVIQAMLGVALMGAGYHKRGSLSR